MVSVPPTGSVVPWEICSAARRGPMPTRTLPTPASRIFKSPTSLKQAGDAHLTARRATAPRVYQTRLAASVYQKTLDEQKRLRWCNNGSVPQWQGISD